MAEKQKEQLQGPETQGNGRMACTDPGGWARLTISPTDTTVSLYGKVAVDLCSVFWGKQ